jgi:thiol-disulfide isomerase/thioredoxin
MTTPLEPLPNFHPDAEAALLRLRAKQSAHRRNSQFLLYSGLALAALLTFGPTRAYTQRCIDACVAIVNPHAALTLADQDGHPLRFANFSGRVLLVNYFATWCEPCRAEVQWLNDFRVRYEPEGLSVLAVSLDEGGWPTVQPFLLQNAVAYPVALQHPNLRQRFGEITSIPTTILVDRSGSIHSIQTGRTSKEILESQIRNLIAASKQK